MDSLPTIYERARDSFKRPGPETWGATPTDPYRDEAVINQQRQFNETVQERIRNTIESADLPESIVQSFYSFVMQADLFERNENHASWDRRQFDCPEDTENFPIEVKDALYHTEEGTAVPVESLVIRQLYGMGSIELAKLSHIGGIGMEHLEEIDRAVAAGIEAHDGIVLAPHEQDEKFTVITCDKIMRHHAQSGADVPINGIVMTRRRSVGLLPDGTEVIKKSRFVLRTDEETLFDADIAAKLRSVKIDGDSDWRARVRSISGLQEALSAAMADERESTIIPISTTVYAHNREADQEARRLESIRRRTEGSRAISQYVLTNNVLFVRGTDGTVNANPALQPE